MSAHTDFDLEGLVETIVKVLVIATILGLVWLVGAVLGGAMIGL